MAYCGLKNDLPSTNEVSKVTFAALRLPAGNASPILSNLSLRYLPPFFDLALKKKTKKKNVNDYAGINIKYIINLNRASNISQKPNKNYFELKSITRF